MERIRPKLCSKTFYFNSSDRFAFNYYDYYYTSLSGYRKSGYCQPGVGPGFVFKDQLQIADKLKDLPPTAVVFAPYFISHIIPGRSGRFVYFGHPHQTVNFRAKHKLASFFFSTKWMEWKEKFLQANKIDYLVWPKKSRKIFLRTGRFGMKIILLLFIKLVINKFYLSFCFLFIDFVLCCQPGPKFCLSLDFYFFYRNIFSFIFSVKNTAQAVFLFWSWRQMAGIIFPLEVCRK